MSVRPLLLPLFVIGKAPARTHKYKAGLYGGLAISEYVRLEINNGGAIEGVYVIHINGGKLLCYRKRINSKRWRTPLNVLAQGQFKAKKVLVHLPWVSLLGSASFQEVYHLFVTIFGGLK